MSDGENPAEREEDSTRFVGRVGSPKALGVLSAELVRIIVFKYGEDRAQRGAARPPEYGVRPGQNMQVRGLPGVDGQARSSQYC